MRQSEGEGSVRGSIVADTMDSDGAVGGGGGAARVPSVGAPPLYQDLEVSGFLSRTALRCQLRTCHTVFSGF